MAHKVKVTGHPVFTMILATGEDAEAVCRAIFGARLEWVNAGYEKARINEGS